MLSKVRGRFTGVDATVTIGHDPDDSEVTAVIDMSSVDSGDATRDDHLRSAGLLRRRAAPDGDLPLLPDRLGRDGRRVRDPWDDDRAVFAAHVELVRGG